MTAAPPVDEVPPERVSAIVEEYESESPTRPLAGRVGRAVALVSAGLSLYALYWVVGIVPPQVYRVSFLLVALALTFLVYPAARRQGGPRPSRASGGAPAEVERAQRATPGGVQQSERLGKGWDVGTRDPCGRA